MRGMTTLTVRDIGPPPLLLSVEECRAQCRLDHDDEDSLLLGYAAAAQGWVEAFTGQRLTQRQLRAMAESWGEWCLLVGPIVSVAGVSYVDTDGAAATVPVGEMVMADWCGSTTLRLSLALDRPALAADSRITIDLLAGHAEGEAPADLRVACLLLVGHWYRNREAVVAGTISSELPLAVESLCIRHRRVMV